MTTNTELLVRVKVLEAKLDATIRALHLSLVSATPTSVWLDAAIEKVDDPNQIGVKHTIAVKNRWPPSTPTR